MDPMMAPTTAPVLLPTSPPSSSSVACCSPGGEGFAVGVGAPNGVGQMPKSMQSSQTPDALQGTCFVSGTDAQLIPLPTDSAITTRVRGNESAHDVHSPTAGLQSDTTQSMTTSLHRKFQYCVSTELGKKTLIQ